MHTKIYFRKYFRNTNLTKNIVMAVPVTTNSTLDNAGVLDPLLKFIIKNWDVTQFIILLIIKKLPPITIHFHNFLVFFYESVFLIFLCFLFIRMFLNFHSFLLSCSWGEHLRHFQKIFDLWFVKCISEEKMFIKNMVKSFSSQTLPWL